MADTKTTPDQFVDEAAASAIEGQIYRLQTERAELVRATERIVEIDAILAAFAPEKDRLDPRRPPKPAPGAEAPVVEPVADK